MFTGFQDPLRALLFTLGGAAIAWLWTSVHPFVAVAAVAAVFLCGWGLQKAGERQVGVDDRLAMRLLETRLLSIGAVTAASGALGVIITVAFASDATGYQQQLASVISGALVAFVTGITYTADKVDAAVGKHIAGVFQSVYVREGQKTSDNQVELKAGSDAERALGSSHAFGLVDWTYDNRHKRLDHLLAYLADSRVSGQSELKTERVQDGSEKSTQQRL